MIGHTLVGYGPHKVLVLHGWLSDWSVFGPIIPSLDVDRFTFAFMDYRGYGKSKPIVGDFTLEEISADANDLVKTLGWDDFSIVGHSMGGAAGLRTALDTNSRVRAFVGVTPVPASGVVFDSQSLQLFESAASSRDARETIIDITTGQCLSKSWLRHMSSTSLEVCEPSALSGYLKSWSKCSFADATKSLEMPMLILVGRRDVGVPEDMIRATYLMTNPQAKLHVVDNAGHYPMQETPVYLATQIQSFIGEAHK